MYLPICAMTFTVVFLLGSIMIAVGTGSGRGASTTRSTTTFGCGVGGWVACGGGSGGGGATGVTFCFVGFLFGFVCFDEVVCFPCFRLAFLALLAIVN